MNRNFKIDVFEILQASENFGIAYSKIEHTLEQALASYIDRIPISCRYERVTNEELKAGVNSIFWELGKINRFELIFTFDTAQGVPPRDKTLAPCYTLQIVRNVINAKFNKVFLGDPKIAITIEGKISILDIKTEFFDNDTWNISRCVVVISFDY